MSDTTKTDILAKHRRPGQVSPLAPAAGTTAAKKPGPGKKAYAPYSLGKETRRHLELRRKFPDPAECPLNSMITNIRGEWRRGLAVTLIYGKTMMVIIKGKNLQELFQGVKEWKIDWIEEYDARFHFPVTDEDAPFVASIEIIPPKTEEPPPMSQRH
jgi:hypothetical protein